MRSTQLDRPDPTRSNPPRFGGVFYCLFFWRELVSRWQEGGRAAWLRVACAWRVKWERARERGTTRRGETSFSKWDSLVRPKNVIVKHGRVSLLQVCSAIPILGTSFGTAKTRMNPSFFLLSTTNVPCSIKYIYRV